MNVHHYKTYGGKDLIFKFIDELPKKERAEGFTILEKLEEDGLLALYALNTRQLMSKLWEIKFYDDNRIINYEGMGDNICHLKKST